MYSVPSTFTLYYLYLYLHSAFPPSIPKGFALGSDVDFAKDCAKMVHYYRFITEQIDRLSSSNSCTSPLFATGA